MGKSGLSTKMLVTVGLGLVGWEVAGILGHANRAAARGQPWAASDWAYALAPLAGGLGGSLTRGARTGFQAGFNAGARNPINWTPGVGRGDVVLFSNPLGGGSRSKGGFGATGAARGGLIYSAAELSAFETAPKPALGASVVAASRYAKATTPWQRRAYQRPDIDWDFVRPEGTNRAASRQGYTPARINPVTGRVDDLVLHHALDDPRGAVIETWRSTHTRFHQTTGREPNPWRLERPDWAAAWQREQSAYWRWRTGTYNPTPTHRLRLPGDQ
jgi:hypothetical protein